MKIIILLLGVSLCVALFFLFAFLWSVNDGQYDDEYGPPRRILFENKKQNIRK
ncbi:MAG: cbb3-type cytochrome oxidase assembly protein CcoS [Saprospiraceae bacterium]|nr:cbb3-type cytochrome oxidase assembly protein CcoS [Saprospiraceae bacterium]MBK7812300.1 cbb3-type cytochrome oxidase assembly protein CcoS [Saprospiraceae bacterium]MBK9632479.1 cbb3-type cytochrome oxidase assembly protein CcoS [Saprospiraceae bacterium]